MSSEISYKGQSVWVSNRRLSTLTTFALQVGGESAQSDVEREWVNKLRKFDEQAWPGIDFDLEERFPSLEEKKFWARIYQDIARRIFLRQLGNQEVTFWQSSAIGDAYAIARMLTRAVQEVDRAWHATSENHQEGDAFETFS